MNNEITTTKEVSKLSFRKLKVASFTNIFQFLNTEHVMACKLIKNKNVYKYYCQYLKKIKFYSIRGHYDKINCLVYIREINKNYILSASSDKTIKIFNMSTCQLVKTFYGHSGPVWSLTLITKDLFASGSSDNTIKIWNFEKDDCHKTLEGHESAVICLTNLSFENYLASRGVPRLTT